MDPLSLGITGALQSIPDIYNLIVGIRQQQQGKKALNGLQRPTYEIPGEVKTAVGLAKANYADPRFEGQNALENRIGANTANAVQMAYDSGDPMNAISAIQANANQAAANVGAEAAKQQRTDMSELVNMMDVLAKYKDQAWQMNKFAPYAEKYNEAREQVGAGQHNISQSLSGLSSIAAGLMTGLSGGRVRNPQMIGNPAAAAGSGAIGGATLSQTGIDAGQLASDAIGQAFQSQEQESFIRTFSMLAKQGMDAYQKTGLADFYGSGINPLKYIR